MRDILIIVSFIFARLSQSVQAFLGRFLDEVLVHTVLNLAFIFVIVLVLKSIRKQFCAQENTSSVREYFIGFVRIRKGDVLLGLWVSAILLGMGAVFLLLKIVPAPIVPTFFSTSSFFSATMLIVLAALAEEIFCRSYIIALLQRMKFKRIFIVMFSSLLFAVLHLSYGAYGALFACNAGIILASLMVMRKSLWANSIAHALYNMLIYALDALAF